MYKQTWKFRASCIALAIALPPVAARAQSSGPQLPYRVSTDANGVNFPTGQVVLNGPTLSIGAANGSHLDFNVTAYSGQISNSATQNYFMSITTTNSNFNVIPANSYAYVALGDSQENFKSTGGFNNFVSASSDGTLLSINYTSATYTAKDGTVIGFDRPSWISNGVTQYCNSQTANGAQNCYSFSGVNVGGVYFDYLPTTITKPNGEVLKLFYEFRFIPLNGNSSGSIQLHLLSVKSSSGLELRFDYASNFYAISKAYGINNAVETCANDTAYPAALPSNLVPSSDVCSGLTNSWPSLSFSTNYSLANQNQPYYLTVSNSNSENTTFNFDGKNNVTSFISPSGASAYYTYTNSALSAANSSGYQVSSVKISSSSPADAGVDFSYNFSYITVSSSSYWGLSKGNPMVAQVSNANGVVRNVVADNATGVIVSDADAYGNKTVYTEDGLYGHIIKILNPDQSYDQFAYDARGNLTSQISTAAPNSNLSAITKTAGYDATCSNRVKCNQPNWTKDGLGNETDYTYDAGTGLLTSITGPADSNNIRPQTRYSYTAMQGYYINSSSGARGFSGQRTYLLTATSICRTKAGAALSGTAGAGPFSLSGSATCAGSADETKGTTNYGAQTAGTSNNLWPVSQTVAAGDGSATSVTSQTYDNVGNVVTSVGPLGTAQTTVSYYDASRRVIGQVGPVPDSSGARTPTAVKYTYANGLLTQTQVGTVADQSANTFSTGFVEASHTAVTYDAQGRPVRQSVVSGKTTYAASDQLYDSLGRSYCRIQYMDMTNVPGATPSTCEPYQKGGAYGADRVTQNGYDNDDRVIQKTNGVGTSAISTEKQDYTVNGSLKYQIDASSNATNYTYDGFGRLSVTSYPSTTVGSGANGASSSSETLSYDANGNVLGKTQRDGSVIASTYDALGRAINRSENGTLTRSFGYDLQGHLTSSVNAGGASTETMSYDALGQLTKRVEPYTTMTYGYDLAGNRTQVTWGDNFTINYSYDQTNNVTAIKENNVTSGVVVLAQYSYDNLGRRQSVAYGNSTSRTYAYDPMGRLTGLQLGFPNSGYNQTIGAVNGTGSPIAWAPSSQMTSISRSNSAYLWTGASNINRSYDVNGLNQYTSSGGVNLGYDGRGNLSSSGSSTFTYDLLNRMSSWANPFYPGGMDMEYGALDELQGYGSTRFSYDGVNINGEYSYVPGGASPMLHRYVYAPGDDEPIVWYVGSDTSQRRFLQADERGSIVAVTDASGGMIATNTYDEFGIPSSSNIGRFQYTGQTWFGELGLYNYKARWYSPSLGKFMQTDPIGYGDGMNFYNYAHGDPINGTDPTGLDYFNLGAGSGDNGCLYANVSCSSSSNSDGITVAARVGGSFSGNPNGMGYGSMGYLSNDPWSSSRVFLQPIGNMFTGWKSNIANFFSSPQSNTPCPGGPRLVIGYGGSATLFLMSMGLSGSAGGGVAIPIQSLLHFSLRGSQAFVTGSVTQLNGLGFFAGAGGSWNGGISAVPIASGPSGGAVLQGGIADGTGGEGSVSLTDNGKNFTGVSAANISGGQRYGMGAYGALGVQGSYTGATSQLGCH